MLDTVFADAVLDTVNWLAVFDGVNGFAVLDSIAVGGCGLDLSFRRLGGVWILHSIHFCPTTLSAPFLVPFAMLTQHPFLIV